MAACSSSALVPSSPSSLGLMRYEVFLNFRGKDTRKGFTGHLHKALTDAGIDTFMDDEEMEAGEEIGERLKKAIEESRYCVIVISKGYADSKWCLRELAHMLEHKEEIIPIFYYVDPSDVRHQKKTFKKAFKSHEEHFPAHVEEWRQAMTKVGELKGYVINHESSKSEKQVIEEIMEKVGGCRENLLHVAEHPVGMDFRALHVMKLLSIEERGVKMVGMYGMGGIGKTSLAKEIYNRLLHKFEKAIYIEGIKDKVKDGKLPKLQQEFISMAFKDKNLEIPNTSEGITEIKRRFRYKRVLVILDDVDHRDQLNALVGRGDWFGEGTRILITTRDMHLLQVHCVDEDKMHEVHRLNFEESLELFCWNAFKDDVKRCEEYMEISKAIVLASGRHPLALEVLGSSLIGQNDKRIWNEVVAKLQHTSYPDIDKCLRISYDGLDHEEKSIFLDVACFFLREEKRHVIDILKGCEFKAPELIINALSQKCLLRVDDASGKLYMHELLRDMGRQIASHSRLWDQQQVWDVLQGSMGTPEIEGIVCQRIPGQGEESLDVEAFSNLSKLRLLLLENVHLVGDFSKMPTSLRSLQWKRCSMKMFPENFNIQKIGFLDLSNSNIIQVWLDSYISKKKIFTNLRMLDLRGCEELVKLPDFSCSLKLEKLYLQDCHKLVSIPDSICLLKNLVYLNISGCKLIKELPNAFGKLEKLIELYLHDTEIHALPYSVRSLQNLEKLSLNGWEKLKMLPSDVAGSGELEAQNFGEPSQLKALFVLLGSLGDLTELRLSHVMLEKISDSMGELTKLQKLQVGGVLRELPYSICNLSSLSELDLSGSNIEELPESISFLKNMRILNFEGCEMLRCLPESIGSLTGLELLDLHGCDNLRLLPSSIGNLRKLKSLNLSRVPIKRLPNSIQFLEKLNFLDIYCCTNLETTLPLWKLESLSILIVGCGVPEFADKGVGNLVEMSGQSPHTQEYRSIRFLDHLKTDDLDKWELLVTMGGQRRVIYLYECNFQGGMGRPWLSLIFPDDFVNLQEKSEGWLPHLGGTPNLNCLRVIDLTDSDMEELDESIVQLPNLKELNLSNCQKLQCLPTSLGCLTELRSLNLLYCKSLTALPDTIGCLTKLCDLSLIYSGIINIPETMRSLHSLTLLTINGCTKLKGGLPLCDWKDLAHVHLGFDYDTEIHQENINMEDVPDDMIEMSGYCEQLQQLRRIRFIGCDDLENGVLFNIWELSVRTNGQKQRVIKVQEEVTIARLKNWRWLRLFFPDDFSRVIDRVTSWDSLSEQLAQLSDPNTQVLDVTPVLKLSEINIKSLPDTTGCLRSLRVLSLRRCQMLTRLPESIGNLTCLGTLDLTCCTMLSSLPHSIGSLTRLENLTLASCTSLTSLPNSIGCLTNLDVLSLIYSGIINIHETMRSLHRLTWLTINGCTELKGGLPLCDWEDLQEVYLGFDHKMEVHQENTNMEDVPDDMVHMSGYCEQLQQLRTIRFIGCDDLDNGLLFNRWELSVRTNGQKERLIKVQEEVSIARLKNWRWLRLFFPDDFSRVIDKVTSWDSLSDQLDQLSDPNTQVLDVTPVLKLSEINFQSLPDTIGCLWSLRVLSLQWCHMLKCLPESIGNLTRLGTLDLGGCTALSSLPHSIGSLTKLETLTLAHCTSLKSLPNSIGNLGRLFFLNLAYSGIEVLPDSMRLLESLAKLLIVGCDRLQGRLPLWQMKRLNRLGLGGDCDNRDQGKACEIPEGITHYSEQAQQYRRIQSCRVPFMPSMSNVVEWDLRIWVEGTQERKILLSIPVDESKKEQSWLRHVFPEDFTPQYETSTGPEVFASQCSSAPSASASTDEAIIAAASNESIPSTETSRFARWVMSDSHLLF